MATLETVPETRPVSDLRTKLNEIEQTAKESAEPVVLTRNGAPTMVLFDIDAYNSMVQEQRQVEKLREAEIEEKYRKDSYTLADSKKRLADIARMVGALNA